MTSTSTATNNAMIELLDPDPIFDALGISNPFTVQFNPTQYAISRAVTYDSTNSPGKDQPSVKFTSGGPETLTVELLFDATQGGMSGGTAGVTRDVQAMYLLTSVNPTTHAPPRVRFLWGAMDFVAVVTSLSLTYTLFDPDGVPLRATASVTFQTFDQSELSSQEKNRQSPDRYRAYTVHAGETLPAIAAREYENPALWTVIADANIDVIDDPRRLAPGTVLTIPKLNSFGEAVV